MANWLVIGASSFTGRHFCEYLRGRGEHFAVADLRDIHEMEYWGIADADYVVNFAAANVVAPSWRYAEEYMGVNVDMQMPLWRELAAHLKRYLHVSTPEVYGSTAAWVTEEQPYNPSTPYAVSRAAAEMLLKCYHKQYGLPVVFTRACNVYGPGQQLYRLIPKLVWHIKHGKRFPLEGGGRSCRAFLHVDDVCAATYIAATKGEPGQAYHITSGDYQSIAGVVRLTCELMNKRMEDVIEHRPERPGKDADYQLRGDRMRELGWEQKVRLSPGVRSVIEWMEREWQTLKEQSTEYEFRP